MTSNFDFFSRSFFAPAKTPSNIGLINIPTTDYWPSTITEKTILLTPKLSKHNCIEPEIEERRRKGTKLVESKEPPKNMEANKRSKTDNYDDQLQVLLFSEII